MDRDLASVQNARDLLARADRAAASFSKVEQGPVDRIVDAIARSATDHAEEMARLAVEEIGFGDVESKIQKNLFVSVRLHEAYRNLRTCGVVREDHRRGLIEIAEPVGVVAGIIPCTNPTSTAIFKILIAVKSRNAIVLSPHPRGARCIGRTVEILRRGAIEAGAPEDLILCMSSPTLEGTQELMSNPLTSVVVATGGEGVVKAAYSSGKPAFGVGPGNPPVFVHQSANLDHVARCLIASQTFDYGTICSSEQSIVAERSVAEQLRETLAREGCHICNGNETELLKKLVQLPGGGFNTAIVGQSASTLARMAGFEVDEGCPILIAPEEGVGEEYPLSREKLAPILAWYEVEDWREGCKKCIELIRYGGTGHTLGIYARDPDVIRAFGLEKPVGRIIVNGPTTQGSVGLSTDLPPSMTLGCGAMGGNITTDNIGPEHLLNLKRVAFPRSGFFAEVGLPFDEADGAGSLRLTSAREEAAPVEEPEAQVIHTARGESPSALPSGTLSGRSEAGSAEARTRELSQRSLFGTRRPPERDFYLHRPNKGL